MNVNPHCNYSVTACEAFHQHATDDSDAEEVS